jgi:predicted dinucleotide-utilizing enzyme
VIQPTIALGSGKGRTHDVVDARRRYSRAPAPRRRPEPAVSQLPNWVRVEQNRMSDLRAQAHALVEASGWIALAGTTLPALPHADLMLYRASTLAFDTRGLAVRLRRQADAIEHYIRLAYAAAEQEYPEPPPLVPQLDA